MARCVAAFTAQCPAKALQNLRQSAGVAPRGKGRGWGGWGAWGGGARGGVGLKPRACVLEQIVYNVPRRRRVLNLPRPLQRT